MSSLLSVIRNDDCNRGCTVEVCNLDSRSVCYTIQSSWLGFVRFYHFVLGSSLFSDAAFCFWLELIEEVRFELRSSCFNLSFLTRMLGQHTDSAPIHTAYCASESIPLQNTNGMYGSIVSARYAILVKASAHSSQGKINGNIWICIS